MTSNKHQLRLAAVLTAVTLAAATLSLGAGPAAGDPAEADGSAAGSPDFAPVDRPGPALSVPAAKLSASVDCTANAADATRDVALFVPGTTLTPDEFAWNWFNALDDLGFPYCSVTLPDNAMADAQVSAEYVVHAIRHVHRISGRKVDVLGHSQGGTEPRFALRFWPDLRAMVDEYIAFGATNHGSPLIHALCPPVLECSPSLHQQLPDSDYVTAMNSHQETFPGISYTNIYTRTDEFVQPNLDDTGTTSLHGGGGRITNVAIQDVCPTDAASEHIAIATYDPVGYALALDALTHDGPADPSRIKPSTCRQLFMPGVNPVTFATDLAAVDATIARELALHDRVQHEPALKSYVLAD